MSYMYNYTLSNPIEIGIPFSVCGAHTTRYLRDVEVCCCS
jgi:hypothetical protein